MEVRLSQSFDERIRAVNPACVAVSGAPLLVLLVSTHGIVVEKTVVDSWAKGGFKTPLRSLEYHYLKHGNGRTRQQYTFDALRFFDECKEKAQWGKWNPAWNEAFRLKIGMRCGYFTPGGRILSYWERHEDGQRAL